MGIIKNEHLKKDSEFNSLFLLINNNIYVHKTEYIYNKILN